MSRSYYSRTSTSLPPSPSCWHYNALNRPKSKHHFLRPCRRRRPYSLPTPVLILRASRGLHSHPARLWYNLPHRRILLRQERTFRLHGHGLSNDGHRLPWLYCMSPPHVYCRNGRRHTSLLYIRYNDYCYPDRSKSIQLTGHPPRRHYYMGNPNTMSPGLHLPIHRRGPNRHRPSQLITRHCPTRHLLRSCPLPLRPIYRSSICHPSRLRPLIPTILRIYPSQHMN